MVVVDEAVMIKQMMDTLETKLAQTLTVGTTLPEHMTAIDTWHFHMKESVGDSEDKGNAMAMNVDLKADEEVLVVARIAPERTMAD